MSKAELEKYVEERTPDEQRYLFICLAERMRGDDSAELEKLDRRMADLDAGRKRMGWETFEARLDGLAPPNT